MSTDKAVAHTPGPWQSERKKVFASSPIAFADDYNKSEPEAYANARLIAAAPDLLAALKKIAELPVAVGGSYCIDIARAAIAKAEGKS